MGRACGWTAKGEFGTAGRKYPRQFILVFGNTEAFLRTLTTDCSFDVEENMHYT